PFPPGSRVTGNRVRLVGRQCRMVWHDPRLGWNQAVARRAGPEADFLTRSFIIFELARDRPVLARVQVERRDLRRAIGIGQASDPGAGSLDRAGAWHISEL